jgi:hypothetical protein
LPTHHGYDGSASAGFDDAAIEERVRHVHRLPRVAAGCRLSKSDGHHGERISRTDSRRSTAGSTRAASFTSFRRPSAS